MSIIKKMSLLLTSMFALTACDQTVEIRNGEIPSEFLPRIQRILGDYHGQMSARAMDLQVALDGNILMVSSSEDLVGPGCESMIGNLLRVTYKEDKIQEAVFAIDPNRCDDRVRGRELSFRLATSFPIIWNVSMVDHSDEFRDCERGTPNPFWETTGCPWRGVTMYKTGRFIHD